MIISSRNTISVPRRNASNRPTPIHRSPRVISPTVIEMTNIVTSVSCVGADGTAPTIGDHPSRGVESSNTQLRCGRRRKPGCLVDGLRRRYDGDVASRQPRFLLGATKTMLCLTLLH